MAVGDDVVVGLRRGVGDTDGDGDVERVVVRVADGVGVLDLVLVG